MRMQAVLPESIVDGPGIRFAVFTQGCPHGCPSCHSPQTHDPEGGYEIAPEELIANLKKSLAENPLLSGVTISGGEPFLHARELKAFAREARSNGLSVWIYTGYTLEELFARADGDELALLDEADALVDGRFEAGRRTLETPFVGSSNQRIIRNPGQAEVSPPPSPPGATACPEKT